MKKLLIVVVLAALGLSGCVVVPYGGGYYGGGRGYGGHGYYGDRGRW